MFLWIAEQLGFPGILNLFRYITFRAGAATATALFLGLLIGPRFIGWLRVRQGKGQPIRDDGPQTHLAKRGTPTMGGLMILTSLTVVDAALDGLLQPLSSGPACSVTVGFGVIGFLDDYDKVKKRSHKGVSGQGPAAGGVRRSPASAAGSSPRARRPSSTSPSTTARSSISGPFYIVFAAFVVVAFGNAVNLTDGLDGLATMPVIIASLRLPRHRLSGRATRSSPPISASRIVPGAGDLHRALLGDRRGGARLPLVQRAAGGGLHGRHRQPRAGRRARRDRGRDPARDRARRSSAACSCSRRCASSSRCWSTSAPASASSAWRRSTIISSSWAGPSRRS